LAFVRVGEIEDGKERLPGTTYSANGSLFRGCGGSLFFTKRVA
jgi:hypothetical protein